MKKPHSRDYYIQKSINAAKKEFDVIKKKPGPSDYNPMSRTFTTF